MHASLTPQDGEPPKRKKKKAFTLNPNLAASISSDGILTNKAKRTPAAASSSLGVPSKKKRQKPPAKQKTKMSKKDRQRTGNGTIDSSLQTRIANPSQEDVQVLEAKRGNKTVTIVRGMTSPMDDRKKLLKEMKRSLGVGGTLVDGVLEIQGPHADKVVKMLRSKGYSKAKKIGK